MHIFYTPDILENPCLPEEESAHCVRVLRMSVGQEVLLADGRGTFYRARIADNHPKHCSVEILEALPQAPKSTRIRVAVAPTKNLDRMEWLVEKLTEMDVDGIYFLNCRFSERRVLKTDRLLRIAVSAMKQSERATLPEIGELADFGSFVEAAAARHPGSCFICHCYKDLGERPLLRDLCQPGADNLVLIGPEGDFSPEEVQLAVAKGFRAVSLGDMRLRTETAALVSALTVQLQSV